MRLCEISTAIGPIMVASLNDKGLFVLRFGPLSPIQRAWSSDEKYESPILDQLESELQAYFSGNLQKFETPLHLRGTPFQKQVWQMIQQIPYGKTVSYAQVAQAIGKPTAFRAIALAASYNSFPIIIPCHRVIKANGDLCGYNGGADLKAWLLNHERVQSSRYPATISTNSGGNVWSDFSL